MKNEQLRNYIKKYLVKPDSLSQNNLARVTSIPPSTFAEFIRGEDRKITGEQKHKIMRAVAPWKVAPKAVAGVFIIRLLKDYFSESEIHAIGREMMDTGSLSGLSVSNDIE